MYKLKIYTKEQHLIL